MDSNVLTVERDNHVATLWLDNPERRNAMGPDFWADLPAVMGELSTDPDVWVVIIAAKGPHFTVGLDLKTMGGAVAGAGGPDGSSPSQAARAARFYPEVKRLQRAISAVADCPKPVIAAVHGWCIGGGVDLISAADVRLCSADAQFSIRETRIAIVADIGTLQRLPRIIGKGHMAELAFTGKDIGADRAHAIGLVNDVLPDQDSLVKAAQAMATEMAANSPLVVQGTKQVLRASEDRTVEEGLDYVAVWNAGFLQSNDLIEAMTAFLEKRPPEFKGE
ncbi:MAG TPA: crotonase/enoyl-CoA hydratase family protein [Acidimicrobiales bacterium]|nr:crotonase/enoyl-CoA hydratase family protein [Acidimicrobiales bacterium]